MDDPVLLLISDLDFVNIKFTKMINCIPNIKTTQYVTNVLYVIAISTNIRMFGKWWLQFCVLAANLPKIFSSQFKTFYHRAESFIVRYIIITMLCKSRNLKNHSVNSLDSNHFLNLHSVFCFPTAFSHLAGTSATGLIK